VSEAVCKSRRDRRDGDDRPLDYPQVAGVFPVIISAGDLLVSIAEPGSEVGVFAGCRFL
jgi:hypothetical protein